MKNVTQHLLGPLVEQGEPSDTGTWYCVPIEDLIARGHTHIEFHFQHSLDDNDWEVQQPDAVRLLNGADDA
jgi:hypothetical protein